MLSPLSLQLYNVPPLARTGPNPSEEHSLRRLKVEVRFKNRIQTGCSSKDLLDDGATDLFCHSESQPLPRECFSGTNGLFPGPRAQEAIVAPLTRQALQHLNRTNNQSSSSAASLSISSEVSSELLDSLALDEPKGTINAYKPKYVFALEERGIYFADDEPEKTPSNLDELTGAIFGSRDSPKPDDVLAVNLRIFVRKRLMSMQLCKVSYLILSPSKSSASIARLLRSRNSNGTARL